MKTLKIADRVWTYVKTIKLELEQETQESITMSQAIDSACEAWFTRKARDESDGWT